MQTKLAAIPAFQRVSVAFRCILCDHYSTKSSATAKITRDARNGHSRSLKVIRCCANQSGILWLPISTQ